MFRAEVMEKEIEEDMILDGEAMAELACLRRGEEEYVIAGVEDEDTCEDAEERDATEMVEYEDENEQDECEGNDEENDTMTLHPIDHDL